MPETLDVSVAEITLTTLQALLSAAALHLGTALPDGRRLARPDAQEAWKAILGASGLLDRVGPLMAPEAYAAQRERLNGLLSLLAERHGKERFPLPPELEALAARA